MSDAQLIKGADFLEKELRKAKKENDLLKMWLTISVVICVGLATLLW